MKNSQIQIHIVGGGIAGLAAAVFAIRDAGTPGSAIHIYEQGLDEVAQRGENALGGCLDATEVAGKGFLMRGGRMFEAKYICTYDLLSEIPSLDDPSVSARDDIFAFTREAGWKSTARLVDRNCSVINVTSMGFNWSDRLAMTRLLLTREDALGSAAIEDVLPEHFFQSNFWLMWCTMFSFQRWHSAVEMRRYLLRFIHLFPQVADLSCVFHTRYNQFHSIVLPVVRWLERQGVIFEKGVRIVDLQLASHGYGCRATALVTIRPDAGVEMRDDVALGADDIVLVTNGSMTDAAALGSWDEMAPFTPQNVTGAWSLWHALAAKRRDLGRPEAFISKADATKWVSFTVVSRTEAFARSLYELTRRDYGREGLITFRDSNWLLTIHPHFEPVYPGHVGKKEFIWWGYGLRPDAHGNYVEKPMAKCAGRELLDETLNHLNLDEDARLEIRNASTCTPCMMPYITSQFMPRLKGDRPKVRPDGAENFAFIGQFAEAEDDVVFTVEYSVRTAKMAIASFLARPDGMPINVPAMYRGYRDLGELLKAGWISLRPSWWPAG